MDVKQKYVFKSARILTPLLIFLRVRKQKIATRANTPKCKTKNTFESASVITSLSITFGVQNKILLWELKVIGGSANAFECKTKHIFESASGIGGTANTPKYKNTKKNNKKINIYIYERDRAQGILTVQPIHFEVRKKKIKDNIG